MPRGSVTTDAGSWCRVCGYNLQGTVDTSDVCPECGADVFASAITIPPRPLRSRVLVRLGVCTLLVLLGAVPLYLFVLPHAGDDGRLCSGIDAENVDFTWKGSVVYVTWSLGATCWLDVYRNHLPAYFSLATRDTVTATLAVEPDSCVLAVCWRRFGCSAFGAFAGARMRSTLRAYIFGDETCRSTGGR